MSAPDPRSRTTAELFGDLADDVRLLVRKELELARIELTEMVSAKLKGAGLIAGAAVASLPGLYFLVVALALWLPVSDAAGYGLVGGGLLLVAAAGVLVGLRLVKRERPGPKVAIDRMKEDVRWAQERLTR